jgi:predicted alpha/beta superfamily hydrolase
MQIYNYYGNKNSDNILIQMIGDHETSSLESEVRYITNQSADEDFCLVAIKVDNWNDELSPWKAPAAFGDGVFGGNAEETLKELIKIINTEVLQERDISEVNLYIGGYSLSGLFALWSAYQTDIFGGVAAVSASVWFPGFYDYISENVINTKSVYLSLGKKEEKTRNKVMSSVGNIMRDIYSLLSIKVNSTLEWNDGNHFNEPDLRTAKGFSWLLKSNKSAS